ARVAHGFWFQQSTVGWVLSFTEDATQMFGNRSNTATALLNALAVEPVLPMADIDQVNRLSTLCAGLQEELFLSREGFRLATHGYLALIATEIARLATARGP